MRARAFMCMRFKGKRAYKPHRQCTSSIIYNHLSQIFVLEHEKIAFLIYSYFSVKENPDLTIKVCILIGSEG